MLPTIKDVELVSFFRVQGGSKTGFSKSREMLSVTDENRLSLDILKKIHIGGEQHNRQFILLRMAEKYRRNGRSL